jgi:hypothetical protein
VSISALFIRCTDRAISGDPRRRARQPARRDGQLFVLGNCAGLAQKSKIRLGGGRRLPPRFEDDVMGGDGRDPDAWLHRIEAASRIDSAIPAGLTPGARHRARRRPWRSMPCWSRSNRGQSRASRAAWLMGAAKHRAIDYYRELARERRVGDGLLRLVFIASYPLPKHALPARCDCPQRLTTEEIVRAVSRFRSHHRTRNWARQTNSGGCAYSNSAPDCETCVLRGRTQAWAHPCPQLYRHREFFTVR